MDRDEYQGELLEMVSLEQDQFMSLLCAVNTDLEEETETGEDLCLG
jgi:hypothetical protein